GKQLSCVSGGPSPQRLVNTHFPAAVQNSPGLHDLPAPFEHRSCPVRHRPSGVQSTAPAGQPERSGVVPGLHIGRQTRPWRQSRFCAQMFKQRGSPLYATQLNPRSESPVAGGSCVLGSAGSKQSFVWSMPVPPVPVAPPVPAMPPAPPLPPEAPAPEDTLH